ncbi:MAG: transposase [Pseudomonadota bacterium]
MASKRHSDEDILKLLREIELKLTAGNDVASACRSVGISEATYYNWRERFGGMGRAQLSELKSLEKENDEPLERSPRVRHRSERRRRRFERQWRMLKKIVAELDLDKLILKESLNHLKPRVPLTDR